MEVSHQGTPLGESEVCLHGHHHDVRKKAEDVNEAATETSNVGLITEGADQVAEGQDTQAIVTEVEEKEKAVTVGQDTAILEHQCEDGDGNHKVGGALQEPGKEVAVWVDTHHFHVLWDLMGSYRNVSVLFISFSRYSKL